MARVSSVKVHAVIVAKLDRLTRSVKDLCGLLELFEKRKVARISVAESLDSGSAAGRLVIPIMGGGEPMGARSIGGVFCSVCRDSPVVLKMMPHGLMDDLPLAL